MDAAEAAGGEPLVVDLVPGGRPGEHDEVAVLAAWHAVGVILRVVGRAEVVPHLVRHGHVGHGGRDVLAVVHQGDDARVETLVAPAVMLKSEENYNYSFEVFFILTEINMIGKNIVYIDISFSQWK